MITLCCRADKKISLNILILSCIFYSITSYADITDTENPATQSSTQNDILHNSDLLEEPINNNSSINVTAKVNDDAIQKRIQNILTTSDWFLDVKVTASEGIIILTGSALKQEHRTWAGNVASRTEGVVAVVNKITVNIADENSLSPVVKESQILWQKTIKVLPSIGISCIVLLVFFIISKYVAALSHKLTQEKIPSIMLRRLIANTVAIPVMLIGIYLVLRITGLGKVATTILGGTGLIGLVLGFAFRDIAENFLASVLISIQRPFRLGETIQVLNYIGVVQAVTTRGTVIMTLEGNHVQIPNTTIYKEAIVNFSANPNMRLDFLVGIGYDASIADAQRIALQVLVEHPAVLTSPEPWVLAEALSASTVNLRIYFWVNSKTHNALKVKSAVIRNIKYAFLHENISMPDDAREVIFPKGIHITSDAINPSAMSGEVKPNAKRQIQKMDDNKDSTEAEGNLDTDIPSITSQANQYSLDDGNTNLLIDKNKPEH